jgi:hypothetical protein
MVRMLAVVGLLLSLSGCATETAPIPTAYRGAPCEGLILQINRETGNRLDYSANQAKDLVATAEGLLKDKKPEECMIKAQEAANVIQLPTR